MTSKRQDAEEINFYPGINMTDNPLVLQMRKIIITLTGIICIIISIPLIYNNFPHYFEFNKIPEAVTTCMIDKNRLKTDFISLTGNIDTGRGFVMETRKGRGYVPIVNKLTGTVYYYLFNEKSSVKYILIKTKKYPEHYDLKYSTYMNLTGIWKNFDDGEAAEIEKLCAGPKFDSKILTGSVKTENLLKALKSEGARNRDCGIVLSGYLDIDIDMDNISFNVTNIIKLVVAVFLLFSEIVMVKRKLRE